MKAEAMNSKFDGEAFIGGLAWYGATAFAVCAGLPQLAFGAPVLLSASVFATALVVSAWALIAGLWLTGWRWEKHDPLPFRDTMLGHWLAYFGLAVMVLLIAQWYAPELAAGDNQLAYGPCLGFAAVLGGAASAYVCMGQVSAMIPPPSRQ
jgi:hypothetical protein